MRALVFTGGPAPMVAAEALPPADFVIAADSGLDHARALGIAPDVVVGDLDSISAEGRRWTEDTGIEIAAYPADKDFTDLELALQRAAERCDDVLVIDSGSGRLDQSLANMLLLGAASLRGVKVTAWVGDGVVTVVHNERSVSGVPGSLLSLLPVGGPATGVAIAGVRWPLHDATLEPGSTWAISNELVEATATISVATGCVLAIQPNR